MLEKDKKSSPGSTRKAYRNSILGAVALSLTVRYILSTFNKSDVPGEKIYDPIVGIMVAGSGSIASIILLYYFFTHTDEHELLAQLWAFTWGFLTIFVATWSWQLLNHSGLLGPVNHQFVFLFATTVGCVVWAWHKFR